MTFDRNREERLPPTKRFYKEILPMLCLLSSRCYDCRCSTQHSLATVAKLRPNRSRGPAGQFRQTSCCCFAKWQRFQCQQRPSQNPDQCKAYRLVPKLVDCHEGRQQAPILHPKRRNGSRIDFFDRPNCRTAANGYL